MRKAMTQLNGVLREDLLVQRRTTQVEESQQSLTASLSCPHPSLSSQQLLNEEKWQICNSAIEKKLFVAYINCIDLYTAICFSTFNKSLLLLS